MKKRYNGKGKRVHPCPPHSYPWNFLPAAVVALWTALSAEEKEVLAYLLPELGCGCFGCYKSFWARWDSSPNRHLIHIILDAIEEPPCEPPSLLAGRRRRGRNHRKEEEKGPLVAVAVELKMGNSVGDDEDDDGGEEEMEGSADRRSSVRRLVSSIGERVWGFWNC
ncbi:hypothetical protein AXF42_Ash005480 [Apostasia shenzhenica]|uniref:Uncharacterized protein n=1 Tax=Apostasia shenzhenica TaxID=1088818 RepID=A0A2I0B720_9ASPA|nr:hypothetical protein AXF42_Ash005480 [Apostasia shenzhenica]